MANSLGSAFNRFLSLFILLLHLGCFVFLPGDRNPSVDDPPPKTRKRKTSPLSGDHSPPPAPHLRLRRSTATKALVSSWSYIKRVFSCKPTNPMPPLSPALTSARSSQKSIVSPDQVNSFPEDSTNLPPPRQEADISSSTTDHHHFPLRNDIFPCTACGEILPKPHLLEQHLAVKHAVTELRDGDSGKNIVRIIFTAGWSCKDKSPQVHRILKIHNSPKILTRFEEYREFVKAKASKIGGGGGGRRDERCIADGNELLRFHCATFVCDLGLNGGGGGFGSGSSSLCNQHYCSVCGIIKSGFSPKMDGISTLSTSWRSHAAIPEGMEKEFQFMNLKRAVLVCRVIAGRVGSELEEEVDKDGGGFDSLVGRGVGTDGGLYHTKVDEEELLVFNPKAVLPCFVIVYTV